METVWSIARPYLYEWTNHSVQWNIFPEQLSMNEICRIGYVKSLRAQYYPALLSINFTRSIDGNLTLTTCEISCRTLKIKTYSLHIFRVVLYERETLYLLPECKGKMTWSRLVWDEVLGKILSLKRRNFLGGSTKLHNEQLLTIRWLNSDGLNYVKNTWERWICI